MEGNTDSGMDSASGAREGAGEDGQARGPSPGVVLLGRAAVSDGRAAGWGEAPAVAEKSQCSLLGGLQPHNRAKPETLTPAED